MEIATTAPDALKILWKKNFFLKPKNPSEIEKELQKEGYNFEKHNFFMALRNAKFLTRKGSKGNFSYIQKHPFLEVKKNENV